VSRNDKEEATPLPPEQLVSVLGALTFASGEPVFPREITDAFGEIDAKQVEAAFDELERALHEAGAGLAVERVAGGYRLATRSDVGAWVRRFFRQRHRARLTPAALETLAIVAYRQPVTAPEIQAIRGKDPSAALRSLLDKKLLRIMGKKKVVGNPLLYASSKHFLDHFGLNSLDDLPSIQDFDEFVGVLAQADAAAADAAAAELEAVEPLVESPTPDAETA